MNLILKKIIDIRKGKKTVINAKNSDRYRIVVNEENGSKTAYYFSSPIYNIDSKKLIDLKFTANPTPALIGSNAKITFSDRIKMHNSNGNCFVSLQSRPERISDFELREGENIILPTTNGFVYKINAEKAARQPINIRWDGNFSKTRFNNKYFAPMLERFTPFMYISAIGVEDESGHITSPLTISKRKISDYEYEIFASKNNAGGKYYVFEINMYEKKLIQDTTVESAHPTANNAFGSTAYIGSTAEFGEQWLYSRIDYMRMNSIIGRSIKSATAYIPTLAHDTAGIVSYKVADRFCSFGSTWEKKKPQSNYVSSSHITGSYLALDITKAITHEKYNQVIAANGLILKPSTKDGFTAITTADSCFLPQIIAINYY